MLERGGRKENSTVSRERKKTQPLLLPNRAQPTATFDYYNELLFLGPNLNLVIKSDLEIDPTRKSGFK